MMSHMSEIINGINGKYELMNGWMLSVNKCMNENWINEFVDCQKLVKLNF